MSNAPLNTDVIRHYVEKLDGEISHPYWQHVRAAALRSPELMELLVKAEAFIRPFEYHDDESGVIGDLLADMRHAIGKGGDQ